MNNTIIKLFTKSYNHLLENNSGLNVLDLEAEIINIASFIYLKDKLDFTLDFVNEEVIERLNSNNFNTVNAIIDNAVKLFSKYYTQDLAFNGK